MQETITIHKKSETEKVVKRIKTGKFSAILKVQSIIIKTITDFMHEKGVLQLMPVILSPVTDPLCHSVFDASIDYYGQKLKLTKSMILHKQISLISDDISKIFIISPNVRLEKEELAETKKHLIEFSQLDIEFKEKTKREFMDFIEELIIKIFTKVKEQCSEELKLFGRELTIPKRYFKVYESKELKARYGKDFERIISGKSKEPFWILDHTREFYDKEDKSEKGYYHNYDLVFPEGYGEALSGGERDYKYDDLVRKMKERKMPLDAFKPYLELAKSRALKPTVGGGIGIERTVKFICGLKSIEEATLFPRIPGEKVVV